MNPSASPYRILRQVQWEERNVSRKELEEHWEVLIQHLQEDIEEYLNGVGAELNISWEDVYKAIRKDPDIWGPRPFGPIVKRTLQF